MCGYDGFMFDGCWWFCCLVIWVCVGDWCCCGLGYFVVDGDMVGVFSCLGWCWVLVALVVCGLL